MNTMAIHSVNLSSTIRDGRTVFLDSTEKAFSPQNLTHVLTHTLSVFSCVESMRKSAVSMCISLWELKAAYAAAVREAEPARKTIGWEAFCKSNFEELGLSQSNIRTAITTGEMLIKLRANDPDGFQALSKLSRAALFAISAAPETVTEIKALMVDPDATVTAAQVRQLKEVLGATEAQANELKQQLQSALDGRREAEEVVSDLNQRCLSMEDQISILQTRTKTNVDVSIPTLQAGFKSEQEVLDQINQQKSVAEQSLSQTTAECDAVQRRLTDVQRKLNEHAQALDVLSGLNKDVGVLTHKYSQVLLQKTKDSNPKIKTKLRETAQLLRILADTLEQ
jgi:hypothetical protein